MIVGPAVNDAVNHDDWNNRQTHPEVRTNMEHRTDSFWRAFAMVMLVVMAGLVGVIIWQGQQPRSVFYETPRAGAESKLATISPGIDAGPFNRYWVSDLAETALPFVVNIETETTFSGRSARAQGGGGEDFMRQWQQLMPFGEPEGMQEMLEQNPEMERNMPGGVGSGFIIREDGYIVTNAHVVDGGDEFTVHFADGTNKSAKLIGKDDFKDIAVLKVDGKGHPVAPLGDSAETRIGEPVIAIGSPIGFHTTVTAGIISANHRELKDLGQIGRAPDIRAPQHYLQTDAAINRGNSGGPLINSDGHVIGVNQAIARKDQVSFTEWIPIEGIGFAIPINEVKESIRQIVELGGDPQYPGISAQIMGVADYIDGFEHLPEAQRPTFGVQDGVYVSRITIKGPADKAGIKAGDVILSIDGEKIDDANAFIQRINQQKVGDRVVLRIARQGGTEQEDVSVVLEPLDLGNRP